MQSITPHKTTRIMQNAMHHQGQYDRTLLVAVLSLLVVGVVMVYSSSSIVALTTYDDSAYFMKRQMLWVLVGLMTTVIVFITVFKLAGDQTTVRALEAAQQKLAAQGAGSTAPE